MKAPKSSVNYRPAEGPMRCSACKNFAAPQSCTLVEGVISPDGVSDAFDPLTENEQANAPQPAMSELEAMFSSPNVVR